MALGRKWFGKFTVNLFGREKWDAQKATSVWSDGGSIKQLLDEATAGLEAGLQSIVAENAILAVSDFAATGVAALRGDTEGEVVLGIRLESGQAAQIIEVPLRAFIKTALNDLRPTLGVDPEAQDLLANLVTLGRQLASLDKPPAQPQTQAPRPPAPLTHQQAAARSNPPRPPGRVVGSGRPNAEPTAVQQLRDLVGSDLLPSRGAAAAMGDRDLMEYRMPDNAL